MQDRAPRICSVGGSNTDLIVRIPGHVRVGECMTGSSFRVSHGGKASNQAVMAACLGARVSVITRLGDDRFGHDYLRNFQDRGIDTRFVTLDAERPSGTSVILVAEATGQNTIGFVPGANAGLTPEHVRAGREAIIGAAVLMCELEVPRDATLEACRIARDASPVAPIVLLNAAPIQQDPVSPELLQLADILVVNEDEAAHLAASPVSSVAEAMSVATELRERWTLIAIITLGSKGIVLATAGEAARHVPVERVRVVDTTGAGDAFVGTLAYQLATGRPTEQAVMTAAAVATVTVTKPGAQPSYPSRSEVQDLLAL